MLYLSILWHMHQPWYLDPRSGHFLLPWVRFHGVKDYLDMAVLLSEFPKVKPTFNLTAPLVAQLDLYAQGAVDENQKLALLPTEALAASHAETLLSSSLMGLPDRMVRPYPRLAELFEKARRGRKFSSQDLRDLVVWLHLVWVDPRWKREIPFLKELLDKGSHFTEKEKTALLAFHLEILGKIIPAYGKLAQEAHVELSTSPWAHPILPLLQEMGLSEDVRWHLSQAASEHERFFGVRPKGLWPSEGAVSQGILPEVADSGFEWLASDEEILWKSLGKHEPRSLLYRPWQVNAGGKKLSILFRDRLLSDLIGFVYRDWPPGKAAEDFVGRLHQIEKLCGPSDPPPLVFVALDGENAWEFYLEDGEPFLRELYQKLSCSPDVRCATVSEYLRAHPPQEVLPNLASGSWIRGDFSTWKGHAAQDRAWVLMREARKRKGPAECRSMAVAQGSDWFWWLGPEHSSYQDPVFDDLFRAHVAEVYHAASEPPPSSLEVPLKKGFPFAPISVPADFTKPTLDGEVTSYFEWLLAGELLLQRSGAMAHSASSFSRLFWGRDEDFLYLRLDPLCLPIPSRFVLVLEGADFQATLKRQAGRLEGFISRKGTEGDLRPFSEVKWKVGRIVEIALPMRKVGIVLQEVVLLSIHFNEEGKARERYPEDGQFSLALPTATAGARLWSA